MNGNDRGFSTDDRLARVGVQARLFALIKLQPLASLPLKHQVEEDPALKAG